MIPLSLLTHATDDKRGKQVDISVPMLDGFFRISPESFPMPPTVDGREERPY